MAASPVGSYAMSIFTPNLTGTGITIHSVTAVVEASPTEALITNPFNFYNTTFKIRYLINYTETDPSGETIYLKTSVSNNGTEGTSTENFIPFTSYSFVFGTNTLEALTPSMTYLDGSGGFINHRAPLAWDVGYHTLQHTDSGGNLIDTIAGNNPTGTYTMLNQWIHPITINLSDPDLEIPSFTQQTNPVRMAIIPDYTTYPGTNGQYFKLRFSFEVTNKSGGPLTLNSATVSFSLNATSIPSQPLNMSSTPTVASLATSPCISYTTDLLDGGSADWTLDEITAITITSS